MSETENQIRLQRAKEYLTVARENRDSAIKALSDANEDLKKAKEKYEELFRLEEMAEVKRRKSNYSHETK